MSKTRSLTDLTLEAIADAIVEVGDGRIFAVQTKSGSAAEDIAARLENVVVSGDDRVVVATLTPDLAAQVAQFAQLAVHNKQMTERLVNAMFHQNTVSSVGARQAQRNTEARQSLIDEFGLLDSEELARHVGSKAKNRSATASRWLADGQVFAVEHLGQRYFPAFQFGADNRPRPIIRRVLEELEPYGLDGWQTALWFTTATGWLDDQRPVDLLATAPDDVVAAGQMFADAAG